MVRKSSRNTTKTSSPEKSKPKTRRATRRNKKSDTTSESENSEEEVEYKGRRSSKNASEPAKTRTRGSRRGARVDTVDEDTNDDKKSLDDDTESQSGKQCEESIESNKQEVSDKDDQSLKPSQETAEEIHEEESSEKKSTSIEEETLEKEDVENKVAENITNDEEVTTVKEDPVKVDEEIVKNEEESMRNEENDEGGKGKSKSNSKIEAAVLNPVTEPQSQSEISENVQVTPVSPSSNDKPVDNDDHVSTSDVENVTHNQEDESGIKNNTEQHTDDNVQHTTENTPPKDENMPPRDENTPPREENTPPREENTPPREENTPPREENTPPREVNTPPRNDYQQYSDDNETAKRETTEKTVDIHQAEASEETSKEAHKQNNTDADNTNNDNNISEVNDRNESALSHVNQHEEETECKTPEREEKEETKVKRSRTLKRRKAEKNDATSSPVRDHKEDVETKYSRKEEETKEHVDSESENNKKTTKKDEDDRNSVSSTEPGEIPKEKLRLKRYTSQSEPKSEEQDDIRKWGESLDDSNHFKKHFNAIKISSLDIGSMCLSVEMLDESEVKLEIVERISLQKSKKTDRKVSVDHNMSDGERPHYDSQISGNSEKSEEQGHESEDNSNIIAMNRKISIVDDTASKLKPPPSPAKNPVSAVLYITNLVRPFTLKQLKEMLERTGKIREDGFWTDRIKSKCYVHYETEEEAEATRNAIHGVNWPIGNGKKLVIEYATPEDMEKARNPPAPLVAPTVVEPEIPNAPEKENLEPHIKKPRISSEEISREKDSRKNETHTREWDVGKEHIRRNRSRSRSHSRDRNEKRRHRRSPSPRDDYVSRKQKKVEESAPQKLMDDLFQKTKAMPSIYWQPLTPEEISMKQQQRLQRMAEHKRRMEETTQRTRPDFGRAGPFRRRYD